MKGYKPEHVRNFSICGQSGSGKTSLSDLMLFKSGANSRLGKVNEGTSVSDFHPEEQEKKHSIYPSPLHCEWHHAHFMFVDTPGYVDFTGDVQGAIGVSDMTLIMVDAEAGIEVGTIRAWEAAEQRNIPRAIFINGLDKPNANFLKTLESIQDKYGATTCVPVNVPVGEKADLKEVVDVLHADDSVPDNVAETVVRYKEQLMDTIAEEEEELMEKYLEGQKLSEEEIARGLNEALIAGDMVPVFCGSVEKDVGIEKLMNSIVYLFPSPLTGPVMNMEAGEFKQKVDGDVLAFVFKVLNDPFLGQVTFARIYSGRLKADDDLFNASDHTKERIGSLQLINGKEHVSVDEAQPGDIVALGKLKHTKINDTLLTGKDTEIRIAPFTFSKPSLMFAVTAKEQGDEEKVGDALQKLCAENATMIFERNAETHEDILSCMGEQQIAMLHERLQHQFKVDMVLTNPEVPYRETIESTGIASYRHKKQSGGRGQFAEVHLRLEPLQEQEFEFGNEVVGGNIPKNFIPAVEKGVLNAMSSGPLANCKVINVKATVFDGKYHPVDSSDLAFQIAGRSAFRDAMRQAKPQLLEPVMKLDVVFPEEYMGDVSGDLNSRRGRINGMEVKGGLQHIIVDVPLAEVFSYPSQLRSLTQGRGTFNMEFDRYETVPAHIAEKIQAQAQKEQEGEDA